MTCRPNLVWGLVVALVLSPAIVRHVLAADSSASSESTITLVSGTVPDIAQGDEVAQQGDGASKWQRSTLDRVPENRGEIRFNKPVITPAQTSKPPFAKPWSPPVDKPNIAPVMKQIVPVDEPQPASETTDMPVIHGPIASPEETVPQVMLQSRMVPTVIASDWIDANSGARKITFGQLHNAGENDSADDSAAAQRYRPPGALISQAIAAAEPQQSGEPGSMQPSLPQSDTQSETSANVQQLPTSDVHAEAQLPDDRLQSISQILTDNQVQQAAQTGALPPSPAPTAATPVLDSRRRSHVSQLRFEQRRRELRGRRT
jgi:hypothetical protein